MTAASACGAPPCSGGCATKITSSPRARAHSPNWNGSSAFAAWSGGRCGVMWTIFKVAVGRLRLAEVRRSWLAVGLAELRERGGCRLQRADRELDKTLEAIGKRGELGRGAIVRTASDDRFARVEEQVEHRL